jgi:SRSO17 transposase
MFPEIKYEKDFYMTAMRIMNKRLHLIRQDLKNEVGAQKAAIKHLETRLHTDFRDGTSFLT